MAHILKTPLIILSMVLMTACSLPRGAALQSEITAEARSEAPTIDVVPVNRANMPAILKWPATGSHGHYHWISATDAPASSIIHEGDRVDIVIWDSQDNSLLTGPNEKAVSMTGLEVGPSGSVFVPYVENVVIRGLTPTAARQRIQNRLEPIVPSAQVQLSLTQGQNSSVSLVSGVAKPGTYPMPGRNYSVLALIAEGGGISSALRNPLVSLIRAGRTYSIPAEDLFSTASKNTTLRASDKVIVQEDDRTFTALGASGTEDLIYFPKEVVTALEALALMSGLNDSRADPKGVLILREYAARDIRADGTGPSRQQVVFTLDLTSADGLFAARKFPIQPGDTVLATESPVTKAQTIFSLFGSAIGFGRSVSSLSTLAN